MKRINKYSAILWTIVIILALVLPAIAVGPRLAEAAANYDLIAFGVKTNSTGTTVTDIGWGRGNSDKGWREGDWVPVKLLLTKVQESYPNLVGLPDIYVGFDFSTGPDDATFVDLVRDIQVGTVDLTDSQGWPRASGLPYPTGNGSAPWPALSAVHTAQTSAGQNIWQDFHDLQSASLVNYPYGPTKSSYDQRPGTVLDKKHQIIIPKEAITAALSGNEGTATICFYMQAHLARTFVWLNSIEHEYNVSPYNVWGGSLYADPIYASYSTEGSSYAPGSSGQMYVNMTGQGGITCQLPVPPKPPGMIWGIKFEDSDGDHLNIEAGESELSGWRMHIIGVDPEGLLFQADSNLTGSPYPSIPTPNGFVITTGTYFFPNLTEGTWYISESDSREVPPTGGWTETFPPIPTTIGVGVATLVTSFPEEVPLGSAPVGWAVTLSETGTMQQGGLNFGNVAFAYKSGHKYEDMDADGNITEDTGNPLSGWDIKAFADTDADGVLDAAEYAAGAVATSTTDVNGAYSLTLNPGKYIVAEVKQANWFQSYPNNTIASAGSATLNPGGYAITLTAGQTDSDNDFGNYQKASKSGMKFEDLNANGAKDAGEPGLADWVIYVDLNDNSVKDAGEPFATTAADGTYTITGITPGGPWKVREVLQAGWINSYPALHYYTETFTSHEVVTGNDFGNYQNASKSGMKFEDLNADGVKDVGEPGLLGWVIYVDLNDNSVKDAGEPFATTAANGTYTITGITPGGPWKVREVAQAGWTCSFPALGYYTETFTSHEAVTGNDFGNWTTASKSGMKFNDKGDADGIKQAGEPVLAGWTIRVYSDSNANGELDQAEYNAGAVATDVTDALGAYSFTLNPGKYIVVEVLQDKSGTPYYQSAPNTGVLHAALVPVGETLGPNGYAITLTSREDDSNNDFGNYWPHTTMTTFSYVWETTAEGNVTLTISDTNDGDVNLYDAHVHLVANSVAYAFSPMYSTGLPANVTFGGDDGDGIFEPGETWTWTVHVFISVDTTFETWGHATDPHGVAVDYPAYGSEYADLLVEVQEATRTQGFWATHLDFTTYVFNRYTGNPDDDNPATPGYIDLGWRQITNINDLMGIFWANNAKNSDGSPRSDLCKARETASNQALAAILNSAMPGGAPLPAGYNLAQIAAILGGTNVVAIGDLNDDLTDYNEGGDLEALDPSLPPTGSANPQMAKAIANIGFADCLIPTHVAGQVSPVTIAKNHEVTITLTISAEQNFGPAVGTWKVQASKDTKFQAKNTVTVGSGVVSGNIFITPFTTHTHFTPLSAGTWYIKIMYSGDSTYNASSTVVTLPVTN